MKPAVEVTVLQQQQYLLSGSEGLSGEISGYSKSDSGFTQSEDEEQN